MNGNEPQTGHDLKVYRIVRRVRTHEIAAEMRVSRSRIYGLEREQFPSDEIRRRYVAAVDTCAASPTPATS